MKEKMNSYGKTWHLWNTGYEGKPGDELPLGDPMLGWSFNRDGEAIPGLVEKRDKKMKINSAGEAQATRGSPAISQTPVRRGRSERQVWPADPGNSGSGTKPKHTDRQAYDRYELSIRALFPCIKYPG